MTAGVTSLVVVGAILVNFLVMGRAVVALNIGLVICFALWVRHAWPAPSTRLQWAYGFGLLVQTLHVGEEYVTAFNIAFPRLFGYEWTSAQFLSFNFAWLAILTLSMVGLWRGARWAYLAVLFVAVGVGIINGLGHLALAARSGGYFPGLYTAPLCLMMGTLLLWFVARSSVT